MQKCFPGSNSHLYLPKESEVVLEDHYWSERVILSNPLVCLSCNLLAQTTWIKRVVSPNLYKTLRGRDPIEDCGIS